MFEIPAVPKSPTDRCSHGNIPADCEVCVRVAAIRPLEKVEVVERELSKSEVIEAKKKIQMDIVRSWAERQDPPMKEGDDFRFVAQIAEIIEPGENIAPHEQTNLYFGYKKEYFAKIRSFFEQEYLAAMNDAREKLPKIFSPWAKHEVTLNYSWAGRYMVQQAAGGVSIDTIPVDAIGEGAKTQTHHDEFKTFFQGRFGFELPRPEELDGVILRMQDALPWYQRALELCNEKRAMLDTLPEDKQTGLLPEGGWDALPNLAQLEYAIKILENAGDEKKWQNGRYFQELPEHITDNMPEQVRHYNDFTYNADDWLDLEAVATFVGRDLEEEGFFTVPLEEGRIDRIFALVGALRGDERMRSFDRHDLEKIERDFSGKLYPDS